MVSFIKEKLENSGCKVYTPTFPTPKNQSLKNWLIAFRPYQKYLKADTIVIGHSLGSAFLLSVLEKSKIEIKAAFFVSGFTGLLALPKFDNLNSSFTTKKFDWKKIRSNCKRFYVINSDNDPYVPLKKGEILAKRLDAKFMVLKNAGHINKESGYTKFGFLLEQVRNELKSE